MPVYPQYPPPYPQQFPQQYPLPYPQPYPQEYPQQFPQEYPQQFPQPMGYGWAYPPMPAYSMPPITRSSIQTDRPLPATVITAGILMLLYGIVVFFSVTVSLTANPGDSPLWLSILTYLIATLLLGSPIFMLQQRRWAYSVCFSLLLATFIMFVLQAIGLLGDVAILATSSLPILAVVMLIALFIVGSPIFLLLTKSARRAFEQDRDPSAIVWAGGGFQYSWQEPFAIHPDEFKSLSLVPMAWAQPPLTGFAGSYAPH